MSDPPNHASGSHGPEGPGSAEVPLPKRTWDTFVLYVVPPVVIVLLALSIWTSRNRSIDLTERYLLRQTDRIVLVSTGPGPDRRYSITDPGVIASVVEDLHIPKLPGRPCDCQPNAIAEFHAGNKVLWHVVTNNKYYWYEDVEYQWPKPFRRRFPKLFARAPGV